MDLKFFEMLMKLILGLGVTLGLIFLSFKVAGTRFNAINNKKYVKVLERTQVTKENAILIVKIGKKGYVMSCTSKHMEKLSELSEEEINIIEENRKKIIEETTENYKELGMKSKQILSSIVKKIRSKEEKNGKE